MEFLDEQGRLFGRVNVIDALVVTFALAIIIAGGALVFGVGGIGDRESPDDRTLYITVSTSGDTGTHLSTGEIQMDGASTNITDVHRTVGPMTYLRVALDGVETERGFQFAGDRIRIGDGFTITDNTTRTTADIIERDTAATFETRTTSTILVTTVRTPVADAISEGDQQYVGETPVATITDTDRTGINETHSRIRVGVDFEARVVDGTPYYGGEPMRLGRTVRIETADYEFEADVIERE